MENMTFNFFTLLSKFVGFLIFAGIFTGVLSDIQKLAFQHKRRGLVSMSSVNAQLVGKTGWLPKHKK